MICLINVISYLLAQQIKSLEKSFIQNGGIKERMAQARVEKWKNIRDIKYLVNL